MKPLLHIISHTDLDGVAAAALAWHAHYQDKKPLKVSLTGYGEVDNLILESLQKGQEPLVLDLFCQRRQTVDELDRLFGADAVPFLFDHHKSTFELYANRPWAVVDTGYCGALVYWRWLMAQELSSETRKSVERMEPFVLLANDRDLWLGQNPDGRLWQGLITLCGAWAVLMRLVDNPSPVLTQGERESAEHFISCQEARFVRAQESIQRMGGDLAFLGDGILEFGDVSDFCGLVLDRSENPPQVAAIAARRPAGDWAVSLRSRDEVAGKIVALLKDGKKVRGGGHGDAAALYFPAHYKEEQIRESLAAAIKTECERNQPTGVTLGDLLRAKQG